MVYILEYMCISHVKVHLIKDSLLDRRNTESILQYSTMDPTFHELKHSLILYLEPLEGS